MGKLRRLELGVEWEIEKELNLGWRDGKLRKNLQRWEIEFGVKR